MWYSRYFFVNLPTKEKIYNYGMTTMCKFNDTSLGIKKLDFGVKRGAMAVFLTDGREVIVPISMFPDISLRFFCIYEKSFLNQSATLYYTGAKFPSTIVLQDLHYFVPYIKGKGIRDVYEIVRMRTITGKEAKQDEGADARDDLRLAFELRFSRQLYKEYRMIDVLQMKDLTFLDTTFSDIDGYVSSYI